MGMESCPGHPEVAYVTCSTCNGSGIGNDGETCGTCGGSGQVRVS